MDLHIFNPEFEFIQTLNEPISVKWDLRYDDIGSFEMRLDPNNEAARHFVEIDDLIVVQGENAAWCNGACDDNEFLITGRTLNHILKWRMVDSFEMEDTIENIIRAKVSEQFIALEGKAVSGFTLGETIGGTGTITFSTDRKRNLYDLVAELCEKEKLGFRINFDYREQKFIFELYRGIDMSSEQSDYPPLILSEINRNFQDVEFLKDSQNYSSCGYYLDTETEEWTEVIKDPATGFYRREIDLTGSTQEEATSGLAKLKKTSEIDGSTIGLVYEEDYSLGDIVTVQKVVGGQMIAMTRRIDGVIIMQESLNNSVKPVLGEV